MRAVVAVFAVALSGCWTEGNSFFLGEAEPQSYMTMGACTAEATSRHADGGPKYAGFRCRPMLLWFRAGAEQTFYEGKRTSP